MKHAKGELIMSERAGPLERSDQHTEHEDNGADEHSSRGTFIIMLVYLVIIIGIWGSVYLILLQRG